MCTRSVFLASPHRMDELLICPPRPDPLQRGVDATRPSPPTTHRGTPFRADDPLAGLTRLEECAIKLVFYVSFMIRSRSTLTALSMRMLSLCMMLFMLASMTAARPLPTL